MIRRNQRIACAIAVAFTLNMCSSVAAEVITNKDFNSLEKDNGISDTLIKAQNEELISKEKVTKEDENSNDNKSEEKKDNTIKTQDKENQDGSNVYDRDSYVPDSKEDIKAYKTFSMTKAIDNVSIVSDTDITVEQAKKWASDRKATEAFVALADLFWKYAKDHGNVNPAVAYVQAAKETGYGNFGGAIEESYHNTCGLKSSSGGDDNDPNAHQKFNTWDEGVQAHLDHLALYAGTEGYPRENTYDPRHFSFLKGKASTLKELGGNWAPSEAYGTDLLVMYNSLADTKVETDENEYTQIENDQWVEKDGKKYYLMPDGSYAKGWLELDSKKYYFNLEDGSMVKGWLTLNGKKYYLNNEDGSMVKGWQLDNGNWYYLTYDGTLVKGYQNLWGTIYFLDRTTGALKLGWINDNGNCYYAAEDSTPIGSLKKGWAELDGKTYYFNPENGAMIKGWVELNGEKYYLNPEDGAMIKGWLTLDGKKYYLNNENGAMVKGWQLDNGNWYYLTYDGTLVKGYQNLWGTHYFLDKETGAAQVGWINYNGNSYYGSKDGSPKGALKKGWAEVDGKTYYFNPENGAVVKGWLEVDGKKYYLNPEDGSIKKGWLTLNGKKYYLNNEDGAMAKGWQLDNGNWYYLTYDGTLVKGYQNLWGTSYFLDRETGALKLGWIYDNGVYYYASKDSSPIGSLKKGWVELDGKWYYFYEDNCKMAVNTTIGDYVVGEDGARVEPNENSKLIVVDPGHDYGSDYGAVGNVNGQVYEETVLNMQVAVQLKSSLESRGYRVQMTRQPWDRPNSSSLTESLSNRTNLANGLKADLFISIHHDAATETAQGITTFYSSYKPGIDNEGIKEIPGWGGTILADTTPSAPAVKSKDIAQKVVNDLASKDSYYNRGAYDRNLYVTKNTNMPSLLLECGFVTNPSEAAKSADLENQKKVGNIVAEALDSELK